MATKTSKVSVTSTSAASILNSTGFGNYTWTEAKTALVNTFVLDKETAIGALSLRGTGDTLKIDGYSGDFTASISGTKLTLIGTSSTGVTQTVKVTLPAATTTKATLNLVFTDGAQHVDYIKGSAATLVNGTHSTTLKAVALPVYGQTSHEAAFLTGTTFSTVADLLNAYNAFANPTFSIVAGAAAAEGANASFTVNLSAPQSVATSVAIGWAGLAGSTTSAADYGTTASIVGTVGQLANNGVLTFPAGVTTATIQIPVLTDTSTPELGEGITLTLSSVTSSTAKVNAAKASGNVTVIDVPKTLTIIDSTSNATTLTATASVSDTYDIKAGAYGVTIDGFARGDKLNFFEGATLNVVRDTDQSDKTQQITATDSNGIVTTITLKNLTDAQDAGLNNLASLDTQFGNDTLSIGGVSQTTVTKDISSSTTGVVNATPGLDVFNIKSGAYSVTIDGFKRGDNLNFFNGANLNVVRDIDNTDHTQQIKATDSAGIETVITLTGLTDAQDQSLYTTTSFTNQFGAGTLTFA